MMRYDLVNKEVFRKDYRVFKGYSVKIKSILQRSEEHFVVPWEMPHEECKKYDIKSLV